LEIAVNVPQSKESAQSRRVVPKMELM